MQLGATHLDALEEPDPKLASGAYAKKELSTLEPGTLLAGKYRVERQLATGGIGVVVVATNVELDHTVAIKYMHPHLLERPDLVERFKREGQLTARIPSDHVVRVYDVAVDEACGPFIVMEYLEGDDLSTILQGGPVPPQTAVEWVIETCTAIAEAHAVGVIHRDLKPENLFLAKRPDGSTLLKILDFGISKLSEDAPRASTATQSGAVRPFRRMTRQNDRFGTPAYMAPEQYRSAANADERADIWSLGVVLFELLTGDVPFEGDGPAEVGANVLVSAPKPVRDRCPDAPEALVRIIGRCLQKDPANRYGSVRDLAHDLTSALPTVSGSAPHPSSTRGPSPTLMLVRRRPRRVPWLPVASASFAAVASLLILMSPGRVTGASAAAPLGGRDGVSQVRGSGGNGRHDHSRAAPT